MAQIEQQKQQIESKLSDFQQLVTRSALFSSDPKKWQEQINRHQKRILNAIRQLQDQIANSNEYGGNHYGQTARNFRQKLKKLTRQAELRERGDSIVGVQMTRMPIIHTAQEKREQAIRQVAAKGDLYQQKALQSAKRMVGIAAQGQQRANQINELLMGQIQQLDRMKQLTEDTRSTLQRAQKNITYFVKAMQCDKCMVGLLALILLALVSVIVLAVKKGKNS